MHDSWSQDCYRFMNNVLTIQSQAESIRKERDMLKMVETRLSQEKESILAQQRNQNLLLSNLKSIQVLKPSIFFNIY